MCNSTQKCGFGTSCYNQTCAKYGSLSVGTLINVTLQDVQNFKTLHLGANNNGAFNFSSIYLCESFWAYPVNWSQFPKVKENYICSWGPENTFSSFETDNGNNCTYNLYVSAPSLNYNYSQNLSYPAACGFN